MFTAVVILICAVVIHVEKDYCNKRFSFDFFFTKRLRRSMLSADERYKHEFIPILNETCRYTYVCYKRVLLLF